MVVVKLIEDRNDMAQVRIMYHYMLVIQKLAQEVPVCIISGAKAEIRYILGRVVVVVYSSGITNVVSYMDTFWSSYIFTDASDVTSPIGRYTTLTYHLHVFDLDCMYTDVCFNGKCSKCACRQACYQ